MWIGEETKKKCEVTNHTMGVEDSVNVPLEQCRLNAQCSNLQGIDTHNPTEHPQHNT